MKSHRSVQKNQESRCGPERRVEEANALLQETVELLSRRCPSHLLEAAAHDDLMNLRPHLEDALAALEVIERQRSLTDEELTRRRAFRILLIKPLL